jgi:hypothetical protein
MAVAVAASSSLPMRSIMKRAHLVLILAALSCSEPIAISQRPQASTVFEQQQQSYSYWISPVDRTVYAQFVNARSEGGESINAFMRRLFSSADSAESARLVIDLRSLTGSDARLLVPLIKGVATRDRFTQAGGLILLVGPASFSPAQNAAALLQQYAKPVFVQGSSYR